MTIAWRHLSKRFRWMSALLMLTWSCVMTGQGSHLSKEKSNILTGRCYRYYPSPYFILLCHSDGAAHDKFVYNPSTSRLQYHLYPQLPAASLHDRLVPQPDT